MKWYQGKNEVTDFQALVESMGKSDFAFASPRRSTVPLLDFWRMPAERLGHLAKRLGINTPEDPSLAFEFPVEPGAGKGKSSFTDLMITSHAVAIAIEAKHREPSYNSCETWLGDAQGDDNRALVLDGWLKHLKGKDDKPLTREQVAAFPYQLIHRTASLFSIRAVTRFLIYQVFDQGHVRASVPELSAFQNLFGNTSEFHIGVMNCQFEPNTRFKETFDQWDRGMRDGMAAQVRQALLEGPIFDFAEPVIKVDEELSSR